MALRSSSEPATPTASRLVWQPRDGRLSRRPDQLAVEEPLEIRLALPGSVSARATRVLTMTMRTPGHDFELATGWLLGEGVIRRPEDLLAVRYCTDPTVDGEQRYNIVTADIAPDALERQLEAEGAGLQPRLTTTTSSCGVCGTASIEALAERLALRPASATDDWAPVALSDVLTWPERLREVQAGFSATGGLHAAGLFTDGGALLVAREDIGRHNAVDKVVGWAVQRALERPGLFPLSDTALVVSGRTSFEIVQKAMAAGIRLVVSVSAASSLAATLAHDQGVTLVGFVRGGRCTVYSHPERLASGGSA